MSTTRRLSVGVLLLALAGCSKSTPQAAPESSASVAAPSSPDHAATLSAGTAAPAAQAHAEVGKPAPDFTLKDLDGKEHKLSALKGKTVVLEWFNPGCPFVKASHSKGSLKDTAAKQIKNGVVWLAINSGAPGKQGHGVEANREGVKTFAMSYPVLLDESGDVGQAYGATNTPHIMVVDSKGVLAYRGAIDNSPDGEGESPTGGKLVNYAEAALADLAAGRPVATPETKAYGCSVKYAAK
ncbi:PPO candidate 1 [Labilithrix luteola]|uniref:PPO candidate 1 n=1 Tax=Labilithrix luteola TaxID=1391654 RepID=A0A0K1PLB7_9BACT|nr:redoxin family protein [Labilithrix luteola]AKU94323.1 PPO candidate 1 [Labilithrix luteola]